MEAPVSPLDGDGQAGGGLAPDAPVSQFRRSERLEQLESTIPSTFLSHGRQIEDNLYCSSSKIWITRQEIKLDIRSWALRYFPHAEVRWFCDSDFLDSDLGQIPEGAHSN